GEFRVTLEIRIREVDQTDCLAGGREVERADIQIDELLGREQREPAMADYDARNVVGQIVMRSDARAIADPDARERRALAHREIVLVAKAGQGGVDARRAD